MYLGFIVTENVLQDLLESEINVPVGRVEFDFSNPFGPTEPTVPVPNYVYLCLPAGVEIDEERTKPGYAPYIRGETWTGADLFKARANPAFPYCSFRFVELARKKRWTNLQFQVAQRLFPEVPAAQRVVNHLAPKKQWPPDWIEKLHRTEPENPAE